MWNEFKISNFRGLGDLHLNNVRRVNLFAGPNNIGKTSILESIYFFCNSPSFIHIIKKLNTFRGMNDFLSSVYSKIDLTWSNLFLTNTNYLKIYGNNTKGISTTVTIKKENPSNIYKEIKKIIKEESLLDTDIPLSQEILLIEIYLEATVNNIGKKAITTKYILYNTIKNKSNYLIQYPPPTIEDPILKSAIYPSLHRVTNSELCNIFSTLEKESKAELIYDLIRNTINPKLLSISILTINNQPYLYVKNKDSNTTIPINLSGDGLIRILSDLLFISNCENGVVFIDEIENGIYYENMISFWQAINKATQKYNTQLFATTHSKECILAAAQAFSKNSEDFCYFRIEKDNDSLIKAIPFEPKDILKANEIRVDYR